MLQSLDHVGRVVVRRVEGADAARVEQWIADAQERFLSAYRRRLAEADASRLLDDRLLLPFRVEQECREFLYAVRHLPRWRYVPDQALQALFPGDERPLDADRERRDLTSGSDVDAHLFTADLEARPSALGDLQRVLVTDDPWAEVPDEVGQVLFLGMGSSTFAASVAAARLRAHGVDAVAELASSELLPPPDPEQLVVAISASGGSRETSDAVAQYAGQSPVMLLTNIAGSALSGAADHTVLMHAGEERGGVSCRSYTHTQVLLLALESRLTGADRDLLALLGKVIEASDDLLSTDGTSGCPRPSSDSPVPTSRLS